MANKTNTFVLNGQTVSAVPFDFNLMCDLDEMGVSMDDLNKKPNSFVRLYVAMCLGVDKAEAGKQIQAHVISGGTTESIINAMVKEMNDSDFFQALTKRTEAKNQ